MLGSLLVRHSAAFNGELMCGIAGAINWGDTEVLRRMVASQYHRGPDDGGQWETRTGGGGWIGLGSRRLAILDLFSAGHIPMSTPEGRYTIVYNGEIYNYPDLREELLSNGCALRSHCDTEAILHLYARFGHEAVRRLNGMFAFAIWDNTKEELFLTRDYFGIKPLYYAQQNGRLAFASEIKAILQLPDLERRINLEALHQYLTFLGVPDPLKMFEGI